LLASCLAACLMHVASFSLPLSALVFPFSHYLIPVMTFTIAGESICQSGKYRITIINSTF
jgi:hypothetical protein